MKEEELIGRLIEGDQDAFSFLVENYQDSVYNTVFGFLKNALDSEDVAQEVFIEVYNAVNKFRADAKLSTWIYRIAVNKSLEFLRRKKRKKRFAFLQSLWREDDSEIEVADEMHPGIQLENQERAAILMGAIDQLPERQKVAYTLNKIEGLSYQEVGKVMELNKSGIDSLMFRAKKNLKTSLADYYYKNENQ